MGFDLYVIYLSSVLLSRAESAANSPAGRPGCLLIFGRLALDWLRVALTSAALMSGRNAISWSGGGNQGGPQSVIGSDTRECTECIYFWTEIGLF